MNNFNPFNLMKSKIYLFIALAIANLPVFSQGITFNMNVHEEPSGAYALNIVSITTDNVDVEVTVETYLKVKVPTGQSALLNIPGWTKEVVADSDLILAGCGEDVNYDLVELSPTSDIEAGPIPLGMSFTLTTFTFPSAEGHVEAFVDNEPCISDFFNNVLNADLNVGDGLANYYDQEIVGGTTLPIDLYDFNAEKLHRTSALLTWSVEKHNEQIQFEIDRSEDGHSWTHIGSLNSDRFHLVLQGSIHILTRIYLMKKESKHIITGYC
jgi:uncharacterized protein YciU (UPF0263 family)